MVETPDGAFVRTVPNASPLRDDISSGNAAEEAIRNAAAVWGMPDFVYRGPVVRKGGGSRERGDAVLIVGELAVVIQVKCRDKPTANPSRERSWIFKNTARALSQAEGTVRSFRSTPTNLTNGRGRTVCVDGDTLRWIAVCVIDHPKVPEGIEPDLSHAKIPTAVLLRRDWEFLFDQLKSTHAVTQYFERVAGEPLELGGEPERYFSLALADVQTTPTALPEVLAGHGTQKSTPLLPLERAADSDRRPHLLMRYLFEDIAAITLRDASEDDRLMALAELDRLPVGDRAEIGRFLELSFAIVRTTERDETAWRFRRVVSDQYGRKPFHLGFGACSGTGKMYRDYFSLWLQFRHFQTCQALGSDAALTSVGVLITPCSDHSRPWDTTMSAVAGSLYFSPEQVQQLDKLWQIE